MNKVKTVAFFSVVFIILMVSLASSTASAQSIQCEGTTNNPHKSHHISGKVNVVGRTNCNANVDELTVRVNLYREKSFLWMTWWSHVNQSDVETRHHKNNVSANTNESCHTARYYGLSYHTATNNGLPLFPQPGNTNNSQSNIVTISSC